MIFKNNAKIKYNLQEELKIVFIKFKFIFLFTLFLFFQFSIEAFASTNLNSISNVKKLFRMRKAINMWSASLMMGSLGLGQLLETMVDLSEEQRLKFNNLKLM